MALGKTVLALGFAAALAAGSSMASANSSIDEAARMRADGMALWRNGDFLGAFGSCYGAKQVLRGVKGVSRERLSEALGFAELCIGLALQQMKVRVKSHDYCRAFLASQKHFAVVDKARKDKGQRLVDGGYLTEQLKDTRCAKP